MKKLLLALGIFLGLYQGVFAFDIVYTNTSDGSKLYKKTDIDSSDGSAITSGNSNFSTVSPDGAWIVYTGSGGFLYKKSSTDTSTGSAITSVSALYPKYLSGGLWIIYANAADGNKIYKKSSTDTSNGSAITSVNSAYMTVSPDGASIVYTNAINGLLYKKSSTDTSNGSAITSSVAYYPSYSSDGTYIVYRNEDDSHHMYKKSSTDTSNGSAITSVSSAYMTVSPDGSWIVYGNTANGLLYKKSSTDTSNGSAITSASATYPTYFPSIDSETTPDTPPNEEAYGTGMFVVNYNGDRHACYNKEYFDQSTSTLTSKGFFFMSGGTLETSTGTSGSFRLYNSSDQDTFIWSNVNYGLSIINPASFTGNTTTNFQEFTTNSDPIKLDFRSSRNYDGNWFNYVKIKTSIGSNINQAHQWTDGFMDFKTGKDISGFTSETGTGWNGANFYYSGGYITAFSPNGWTAQRGLIYSFGSFNFQNFEIGTWSGGLTTLSQCNNGVWNCEIRKEIDGTFSCNASYYDSMAQNGECGFVAVGGVTRCLPTDAIVDAPINSSSGSTGKALDTGANIFTCEIRDGLAAIGDLVGCPLHVISNIWSKFVAFIKFLVNLTHGVGSFGSPKGTGDIFGFIPEAYAEDLGASLDAPLFHTFSGTDMNAIKPDYAETYTGKDIAGMNYAMFRAGDNVKNMERGGIKGILAFSQYFLIIVSAVSVFAIVLLVIKD